MCLAPTRDLECILRLLKEPFLLFRNELFIVERHSVIACIPLGTDEPCFFRDAQTLSGQEFANSWVVGHLRECARVGPPAPTPARAAIVGGFMGVVEADRSV